ncbi:hypothetical protein L6Q96_19995 [Candidatus Binatia bacterium]|nr:hypothetical protein [Candidatus Binatia bacterium]
MTPLPARAARCRGLGAAAIALLAGLLAVPGRAAAEARETFSLDYIVELSQERRGIARVRWEGAGLDEINAFVLRFAPQRFTHIRASGTLETLPDGRVRWSPKGPYGHLQYDVRIDHRRASGKGYDSYAAPDWVVTRARALFPRILVDWDKRNGATPEGRSRLLFRMPPGWRSATAIEPIGPDTYRPEEPGKVLDRPRGWFALGKIDLNREDISGTLLQVARAPGSALAPTALFEFLAPTLPLLQRLLATRPERLLVVSAPDPMWRGGISGMRSVYVHGDRPLRTPDKTSPYLHELFHVMQPFKCGNDADWVAEGLAEYYSLELQRRTGLVDQVAFERGLRSFARYGLWNVDLTRQHDNAATNNSAPLVMYALDQRIQRATAGKRRLDDVVTALSTQGGTIDSARFAQTVRTVAGKSFRRFFQRHVVRGELPNLATP